MRNIAFGKLICGLSLALLVTLSSVAFASPDQPIPPLSGICDGLVGGTPALYGLCLAYCESPHPGVDKILDPDAAPKRSILDAYRSKMQPGDPDMPCLQPQCPCWTEEELAAVYSSALGPFACTTDDGTILNADDIVMLNSGDDSFLSRCFPYGTGFPVSFSAQFFGGSDHTCAFLPEETSDYHGLVRFFAMNESEFQVCKTSLLNRAAALGLTCIPLQDVTYGGGIPCNP